MKARTLACVIITPLGVPVDPDVKRMCAPSTAVLRHAGGSAEWLARSPAEKRASTPRGGGGASSHPTAWVRANSGAANKPASVGPTAPPARIQRLSHAAIIFSTRATGLPGSSGTYIASALSTARIATIVSGDLGLNRHTRSPRAHPASLR